MGSDSKANWRKYFASLADELGAQSTRVRNLIGGSHWGADGHHKEYLVLSLLGRHMPAGVLAARGFVVGLGVEGQCSREQDLLIVDAREHAPLFHQGGIIIALPSTVVASISIKTTLSRTTLIDTIDTLSSLRRVVRASGIEPDLVWCGGYFFGADKRTETTPESVYSYYEDAEKIGAVDIATGGEKDLFFSVVRSGREKLQPHEEVIRGFGCNGLATAIFIALALDHLAARSRPGASSLSQILDRFEVDALIPPHRIVQEPTR